VHRAAFRQRALVVGQAIFRFGVSQKPQHAHNSSRTRDFPVNATRLSGHPNGYDGSGQATDGGSNSNACPEAIQGG
jgi:hypothetical protein